MSGKRRRKQRLRLVSRRFPDPRLLTVGVTHVGGVPVSEPTFVFPIDRLRLPDGRILGFHAPLISGLYLITAKELRDRGERERRQVMTSFTPERESPGVVDVNISNDSLAMDAVVRLASAVILAAGAIEAYANEAIDRLPATETVSVERRGETVEVEQVDLVRRLSLEEKLDLVVPRVADRESIKGREPWPRFKHLMELRGEVVHVKARGRTDDPDVPSALGRLLLGEGSACVEDAAAVVVAYEPTWLPDVTRTALGI